MNPEAVKYRKEVGLILAVPTALFALAIAGVIQYAVGLIVAPILMAIIAAIYGLPTIVAYRRQHREKAAIMLANILFGWTFVGWGLTLVWACTASETQ